MYKKGTKRFAATAIAAIIMGIAGSSAMAGGFLDAEIEDPAFTFLVNPLMINNPYWPLNPGGGNSTPLSFTYEAESDDECVVNTLFINSGPPAYFGTGKKTVTVGGTDYDTLEVLDIEWIQEDCEGDLIETEVTLDWYAQDDFGNIWYMGELSRSFDEEDGCHEGTFDRTTPTNTDDVCYAGSWEAGVTAGEGEDAVTGQPGIVVPSNYPFGPAGKPLSNGTHFLQEIAYEAEDMAKILKVKTSLSVNDGLEPGDYDECRKVKEWNPFEPGASVEHKWYCADGAGLVLIEGIGGGRTEVETLIEVGP